MFSDIVQVCIATNNLEATLDKLNAKLSIGQFKVWDYKSPILFETEYNQKPTSWTMKLAIAYFGNLQIEVIQPTSDSTLYGDFLKKYETNGLQHFLLKRDKNYDTTILDLKALGLDVAQSAKVNPALQLGPITIPPLPAFLAPSLSTKFAYFKTFSELGLDLEISQFPPTVTPKLGIKLGKPDFWYPQNLIAVSTNSVETLGFVVENIEKTVANYQKYLGLNFETPVEQILTTTSGEEVKIKKTVLTLPTAKIELVQPISTNGVFAELLKSKNPNYLILKTVPTDSQPKQTLNLDGKSQYQLLFTADELELNVFA